ncbi:MAG: dTDP-4-dehydrorhamnose reductase [Synechococcaceae cyanobacterium ELA445]
MTAPLLLIGRQGQVATAVQQLFVQQLIVQRLAPELLPHTPLVVVGRPELDLATATQAHWAALLEAHQPALVLNAAAYTAVDRAESEPELAQAINATAVGHLARACAERGLPLLHLSTDYVFSGGGERPWREDDPTGPLGVYGASKLAGEQALRAAGGPHLLLRVSWVFGQSGQNFVRTMLRLGAERPELRIIDDQIGSPTSAESIATTVLALADQVLTAPAGFPWGTYHFASQPTTSWHGFAAEIFRQAVQLGLLERAPTLVPIPTSAYPTPAARPPNSRLDTSRFVNTFALPLPDWRQDLRHCLESWRTSP